MNPAEERAERDRRRAAAWELISRDIAANLQSRPDADCDRPAYKEPDMQFIAPDPIDADDLARLDIDYAETADGRAWHKDRHGEWSCESDGARMTDHELATETVTLAESDAF